MVLEVEEVFLWPLLIREVGELGRDSGERERGVNKLGYGGAFATAATEGERPEQ